VRALRKRGQLPTEPLVESGSFLIQNGKIIGPGATEPRGQRKVAERQRVPEAFPVEQTSRILKHHLSPMVVPDQVIPDDLIVQGSLCVGFDCVNGEVFNFDTIKLKENNLRIKYEDTSISPFPSTDWQLTGNDSASGGANKFSIDDITAATTPFTVTGGATTNSMFVASNGKVGFRTSTPVLDLHVNTSDTPAARFEQNNSGGWGAQTWDIGANEANFFVRDVTSGSRLVLRIRPGAPTSSLDITTNGDVGIGTTNPVFSNNPAATRFFAVDAGTGGFSEIGAGGNQTGTTSILGAFAFFNSSLGGPEKRNAVIVGANDGATNSGNIQFFTVNLGTIAERMRINRLGQVGIGTPAPTDTLSVNGTASKPGGGSWSVFSDERLKTIKGEFTSGLKAVMQLQPLRYVYRSDNAMDLKSQGEHVGFGAQTLQKVIPEAVTRNDQGYLMVNNDPVIWTMLNAIKEQQREIEELRSEVKQLKAASRRRRK
jgi:hypothetical protein